MTYSDDYLMTCQPKLPARIPGAIQLSFGQLEIGHYQGDNIRTDTYTRDSDGVKLAEHCHVTGINDRSERYTGKYDFKCSCCFLGHTHSIKCHAEAVNA